MDKAEAERIAKAIRRVPAEWIEAHAIELNPITNTYEIICVYKQRYMRPHQAWTEVRITSPRQWIALLTQRAHDVGGLELP
jgi:hypothetical protein